MKPICVRGLLLCLAALLLLCAVACGKKPADDPGYVIDSSNTQAPEKEIPAFYEGNAATVEALAKHMMKSHEFLAYNYYNRMVDYDEGTMEFLLQKQTKSGGVWVACNDESAARLLAVRFVGTVTYNPAYSKDVVVFAPRMAVTDKTLSLAYCVSDKGKAALEAGKYHPGCTVTLTQIEGSWYCIEAVKTEP